MLLFQFSPLAAIWQHRSALLPPIRTVWQAQHFLIFVISSLCPLKKKKVKWSRYRPGVTQRVGRGIALLFHVRGTRRGWVVSSTPRPHFTPGKTRYPFYRRLGGPQGRSGRAENLVPTGIRSRTVQPVVRPYTVWATRPIFMSTSSSLNLNMTYSILRGLNGLLKAADEEQNTPLLMHEVTTIRPFSSVNLCSNTWFGIRARTWNMGYDPRHHLQRSKVQRITRSITHPPNAYAKVPGSETWSGMEYPFF